MFSKVISSKNLTQAQYDRALHVAMDALSPETKPQLDMLVARFYDTGLMSMAELNLISCLRDIQIVPAYHHEHCVLLLGGTHKAPAREVRELLLQKAQEQKINLLMEGILQTKQTYSRRSHYGLEDPFIYALAALGTNIIYLTHIFDDPGQILVPNFFSDLKAFEKFKEYHGKFEQLLGQKDCPLRRYVKVLGIELTQPSFEKFNTQFESFFILMRTLLKNMLADASFDDTYTRAVEWIINDPVSINAHRQFREKIVNDAREEQMLRIIKEVLQQGHIDDAAPIVVFTGSAHVESLRKKLMPIALQ